jgi:hypothetical protein
MIKKIYSSIIGSSLILIFAFKQKVLAAWDPNEASESGLPDAEIYDIVSNILDWILTIVGIVGVIGFAIAGLMYLTAAGQDDQLKSAKKAMLNSIIGVIVAICGVVVLYAVDNILNATGIF